MDGWIWRRESIFEGPARRSGSNQCMTYAPLNLNLTPEQVVRAWPSDERLAALWSGGGHRRSRWTVLARPTGEVLESSEGAAPRWPKVLEKPARENRPVERGEGLPPFVPGWLGMANYELGRLLEPSVARGVERRGAWPLTHWQRFEDALVFDHVARCWWAMGARATELAARIADARPATAGFALSLMRSVMGREKFEHAVAVAIEHIRAGDIYQVNLTHVLEGAFSGSSRELFLAMSASARPWYGSYLEWDGGPGRSAIASVSPELFLSFDPRTRRVETRPMKGTRRVEGEGDGAEQAELMGSVKDRAELAMIVDLMRNDLGRVCEARSIGVDDLRALERHSSLLQTTATVSGVLPPHRSLGELLGATFPGGSITGVPKIRAMQIIEDLELTPRGPYCGCLGYAGDDGALALSIAIRTAVIRGRAGSRAALDSFSEANLEYAVGAGIVADSTPGAEWEETLAKADAIGRLARIV